MPQSAPGTATISGGTTFSDARSEGFGGTSVPRSPKASLVPSCILAGNAPSLLMDGTFGLLAK